MAFDQLSIYNEALRIVGERPLASLAEAREPKTQLDGVWAFGAVEFVLSQVKPRFATTTAKLTVFATDPNLGFANVFTLPADYLEMVAVYSDAKLDEPVTRYIVQGDKLATDHTIVYVRYVSSASVATPAEWSQSFARCLAAYMAWQIVPRIKPDDIERVAALYDAALLVSQDADGWEEPTERSQPVTVSLTAEWKQIYDDALFCMGLPQLISANDDSDRRAKLDAAVNQGAVLSLLEKYQWSWANTSRRIDYDPDIETEWGYRYGFEKPADMERIKGVFTDEGLWAPLKMYADEGGYIFSDNQTIYIQYVSSQMTTNPALWPQYFRDLVGAYLAMRCAAVLNGSVELSAEWWKTRHSEARNTDAMQQPPRVIQNGSWTAARMRFSDRRRRP